LTNICTGIKLQGIVNKHLNKNNNTDKSKDFISSIDMQQSPNGFVSDTLPFSAGIGEIERELLEGIQIYIYVCLYTYIYLYV
jgi:hypothetical protein